MCTNFINNIKCVCSLMTLRVYSLFESTQTLFWATYGLIDLNNFELHSLKSYTKFWAMLMFGVYSVINVTVLINLLIAMMNHSYQLISVSVYGFRSKVVITLTFVLFASFRNNRTLSGSLREASCG